MSGDRFGPNPTAVMPADATAAPHARMSSPPQMTAGNAYGIGPEPAPTLWQKIQHLPFIGRDASDQFREDIAQAWQGIKERFSGYRAPTAIPYVGLAMGAANAVVPEAGEGLKLSQESKAALDALGDVSAGVTQKLPKFAILSADKEGLLPQVLKERHAALGQMIQDAGHEPIKHKGGIYLNDAGKRVKSQGYIVPGMDTPQARHISARVGQDAVITNEGYHDVNTGMTAPFKDAGAPVGKEPYTVLPNGKKLALRFDFDNMKPTGTPEPGAVNLSGRAPKAQQELQDLGATYRQQAGLTHPPLPPITRVSPAFARKMADTYSGLQSAPNDPRVQSAYQKFVRETGAQAQALKDAGYSWTMVDKDPYKSSAEMLADLKDKHINVLRTAPDQAHPLMTPEQNDEFRAVHDILGHGSGGHSYGPIGEENTFRRHAALYSPEAQGALAMETRGQNSWFNFGPHADTPIGQRPFAEQKANIFPHTGEYEPTLPAGAPSVLGYPQRHGLPLAREDAVGLGIAGRHLLSDFPKKADWLERMKAMHPSYAPHLEGKAGEQAWAAATRAKTPVMPSSAEMQSLAHSATGESTRPWYHTWAPAVEKAFGKDDGEMLTRFHAILSAQASPARNAEMSLAALHDYKAGDMSFKSVGTMGDRIAALQRQAEVGPQGSARMAQEGPKVNNFYLALKGHPEAVVLDRHMGRAYLGKERISDAEYPAVEARVRQDAAEAGQSPRDFQAMVWGGQTKYPFQAPEEHLWEHMSQGHMPELLDRYPALAEQAERHAIKSEALSHEGAPTHAAVRFVPKYNSAEYPPQGTVHEVPMARGHAGALQQAIEKWRSSHYTADDIMNDLEDGYTWGDGKFIPRADVDGLHTSDFINGRKKPGPES